MYSFRLDRMNVPRDSNRGIHNFYDQLIFERMLPTHNEMNNFPDEFDNILLQIDVFTHDLSRSLFDHTKKIKSLELRNQHNDECSICLDGFCNVIGVLPCGHSFHKECILKWVENKDSCPCCRDDLTGRTNCMTKKCSDTINKFIEKDEEISNKQLIVEAIQIVSAKVSTVCVVQKIIRPKTHYFRNTVKDSYKFKRQNRSKGHIFHH